MRTSNQSYRRLIKFKGVFDCYQSVSCREFPTFRCETDALNGTDTRFEGRGITDGREITDFVLLYSLPERILYF